MKKYIYILTLIILINISLLNIGLFDSKTIKIGNFIIEKPLLYRNPKQNFYNNNLDSYYMVSIMFLSYFKKEGILYDFIKVKTIDEYKFIIRKFKLITNINNCYVKRNKLELKNNFIETISIYKYPYIVKFNEISKERKEKLIQQVCEKSSPINL